MSVDEEVVLLEEQLATAHADVERLQGQLAELTARQTEHDAKMQALRDQLQASQSEAETAASEARGQAEEIGQLRESMAAVEAQGREAVQRYREVVLEREPQLPADLVAGESIGELDAAVERARLTVAQVRQHLEQQAQALRVPAGAPARGSPDLSELSSAEKIRLGLSKTWGPYLGLSPRHGPHPARRLGYRFKAGAFRPRRVHKHPGLNPGQELGGGALGPEVGRNSNGFDAGRGCQAF